MIDGKGSVDYLSEVGFDFDQPGVEAGERGELGGDARGEGTGGEGFDVAEEMLDTDLFCFFRFD